MNKISRKTRTNIIDILKIESVYFAGELSDIDFLSRIFDLKNMPSDDISSRYMEDDIWQHRVNNPSDWKDDWVYSDPRINLIGCNDAIFLKFICELLHPLVRPEITSVIKLKKNINECLIDDDFEIIESSRLAGRPVFEARKRLSLNIHNNEKEIINHLSKEYITKQINLMEAAIYTNPHIAIGLAKELIETICKTILDERNISYDDKWDLLKLLKGTNKELKLTPDDIPDTAKASITIKGILGSLANVVQGIAELRNSYGGGHGKGASFKGLGPRHAKLAVGAATTLVLFLYETHKK